VAEWQNRNWSQ